MDAWNLPQWDFRYSVIVSQSIVGTIQALGLWKIYATTGGSGVGALSQLLMRDQAITFFIIVGT